MYNKLESYMRFYHKALDKSLIEETMNELMTADFSKHEYTNPKGLKHSYNDDLYITYNITTREEIMKVIKQCVFDYLKDLNFSWFNTCNMGSLVRFNKYTVGTNMKKHCDHIKSVFKNDESGIPILSVLGALNDNYRGGELIFFNKKEVILNGGDIMIFPSNFLYPHQVRTVTEGTRFSFVSWFW